MKKLLFILTAVLGIPLFITACVSSTTHNAIAPLDAQSDDQDVMGYGILKKACL